MLKYSYKLYYEDHTSKMLGGKSSKPENLKYDFDGLISWEEYDKITSNNKLTAQDVVNLAKEFYNKKSDKKIIKVEIINIENEEIIVTSN